MIQYFNEWSEDSPIEWWNEGRKKLNVIIRAYNAWQRAAAAAEGAYTIQIGYSILADIEQATQTWASQDGGGGGGWQEELARIRKNVRHALGMEEA